jgi:hypothetical protein
MCDDHKVTRRRFLQGAGAVTAGGILLPSAKLPRRLPLRSAARPIAPGGNAAYSMAMHIHSSFSEQNGSMDGHLYQATEHAVDVCWWTEHDARLDAFGYRDTVHFTSLTAEAGGPGQGKAWSWQQRESGPLASGGSGGGIVTNPCSPNDPVTGGSLSLSAQCLPGQGTGTPASFGFYANSSPADDNYRDNLTGQSLSIDVLLGPNWANGYLELLIGTSYHQASAGRPAGNYSLSYRFVPAGQGGGSTANGNQGVITIPVTPDAPGDWATITITPGSDIASLWPDLDYRDFALWELTLSAVSTGDAVSGYFDYLNFSRTNTGGELFTQQQSMMQALAGKYPAVTQLQGLECSWDNPHCNWFGPDITVPTYQGVAQTLGGYLKYLEGTVLPGIHAAGGLFSYNHPFGTKNGPLRSATEQAALLRSTATSLLPSAKSPSAVLGADLLEVGYVLRGGCDVGTHLGLWDVFSRNAIFLSGNGTSDDHVGTGWKRITNNWITSAWAASPGLADLMAAMAAGQIWCGSLSAFGAPAASLNLTVDGTCPMGSASLSTLASRQLTVQATGLPAGGSLQVLQGAVDYAGTADPTPDTKVIAAYTRKQLASGQATLAVDTSAESFVRTVVLNASGAIVGASNPVWMLQNTPPNGIPAPRQA